MEGNPPAFPKAAVISQLREVRTGTSRSVSPVRLNQGTFLASLHWNIYIPSLPQSRGDAPCSEEQRVAGEAKRPFPLPPAAVGSIHSFLHLRRISRLSARQTGGDLVGPS